MNRTAIWLVLAVAAIAVAVVIADRAKPGGAPTPESADISTTGNPESAGSGLVEGPAGTADATTIQAEQATEAPPGTALAPVEDTRGQPVPVVKVDLTELANAAGSSQPPADGQPVGPGDIPRRARIEEMAGSRIADPGARQQFPGPGEDRQSTPDIDPSQAMPPIDQSVAPGPAPEAFDPGIIYDPPEASDTGVTGLPPESS